VRKFQPAIAFVLITLFLDILGIGLIIPILPQLIIKFSAGDVSSASRSYGILIAIYATMQFLFAPLFGSLSDRFGRRPIILCSLFGSGLDYLVLATAPNLTWFFIARAISGVTGASITSASAYIADVSPPEKRAQSFGLIGAAFGLGFIAGPALGGLLGNIGLRLPFFVAAGLTLLNWLYGLFILPESLKPDHRRPFSWARANPLGSLLALRNYPVVLGLTGTFFLLNLVQTFIQSTWVLYTGYRYHWTVAQTGVSLAIIGLMAAIVQGGLVRVVVPKLGERRAIIVGLTIGTFSQIGYGLATQGWMIYAILVFGCMGGIAGPAAQALISKNVAVNEQGSVQGSLASLGSLAGIIGPPTATGLFGYFISPKAPVHLPGVAFFVGSMMIFCSMLLAVRTFRKTPEAQPVPDPILP
jgi:DHA1 family tetracycline resistance protein-like MFS transporter